MRLQGIKPMRLIFCLALATALHGQALRDGWAVVPGAEDLIVSGQWECAGSFTLGDHALILKSGSGYVTPINTSGPHLQGQGDFAVQASISNRTGAGFLTLVGVLGRG